MDNREEITKEINQKAKQWDKKSDSEKFDHIESHLIKAREELEKARNEMGWLTLKDIVHHTYNLNFSKAIIDIQERILIDLEDDLLEGIRIGDSDEDDENEDEGK